jgi:predicted nuclease of predicted toxin-antitoxin system
VRLLLDEDAGAHSLLSVLRNAGHDVERVVDVEVLGSGSFDDAVLAYAVAHDRVLITYNGADFLEIVHAEKPRHPGILVIHYTANGTSLPAETIARAITNVEQTYPATDGLVLDVNHHVW